MPKTALVTGSAGFIGSHMVRELESRGYDVSLIDIAGTIHPPSDALKMFAWNTTRYDLVIHAAYHVGGRAAIDGTNTNFAKNLQLDAALFEWAVRTKQRRVLYFSSSAAYPVGAQSKDYVDYTLSGDLPGWDVPSLRLREDMIRLWEYLGCPDANYGWAKLTGERLAEDARRNGLSVSVVRPFSGYGEDQSLDYPFPSIVRRARDGDLTVWGPPGQSRDWIHVDDVINGSLAVVDSDTRDAVNLCTGVATEMGELALKVHEATLAMHDLANFHMKQPTYLTDKPYGVFYRVGDPARLHQYYTPKISLEEGIRRALQA